MKTIQMANGDCLPALGLGTWKSAPGEVGRAVEEAVRIGYRHFDCAWIYGNEAEIGQALARCLDTGLVTREELWITSKLWNDRHASDEVVPALQGALADLRLDYVDLYLVHWPVALQKGVFVPERAEQMIALEELPLAETWRGMEAAHDAGLARHLGVSNLSPAKVRALCASARVWPEVNQVELHPYLQQTELLEACRELGVAVTAYSPLGSRDRPPSMKADDEPNLLADPVITSIAARLDVSPAQVLLAWAVQRGTSVIPKSVNPARMQENDGDMRSIAALDRASRYITGAFWVLDGGPYTLANLWDE
jgi:alcohol dehydrogenase (NADP+)